jgi:Flp pilus assembly protein TadG
MNRISIGTNIAMANFHRLLRDCSGNFGMITAVMLPVLLGAAGFAVDITNAMQVKGNLQGIADAASLAAASAMSQQAYTKSQAEDLAENYFVAQIMSNGIADATTSGDKATVEAQIRAGTTATATATTTGANTTYTVQLASTYTLNLNPITGILAGKTMNIGIKATSTTGTDGANTRTGISMYLALDRSGSMSFATTTKNTSQTSCVNYNADNWWQKDYAPNSPYYLKPTSPCYIRKIDALKTAATALFTALKKADTSLANSNSVSTLVRTGADSYTEVTQAESPMAWGTSAASTYIQNLPSVPTGGTDANGAMQNAFNALKQANATEATAHNSKSNTTFNRFVVLMTDGEMTGNSSDWNSSLDKSVRDKCDTDKKDGIKIFTVAFMAPDKGKSLLSYCATSSDYYYSPDDMSSLVSAFGDIADKAAKQTVRLTN